jgi:hypothetical protein
MSQVKKIILVEEDFEPYEPDENDEVHVSPQTEVKMCRELSYPNDEDPEWKAKFAKYQAKSSEIELFWLLALLITDGNDILADQLLMNNREKFFEKDIIKAYMVAKEISQGTIKSSEPSQEENIFFYYIAYYRTKANSEEIAKMVGNPKIFFKDRIIYQYFITRQNFKKCQW